MKYCGDKVIFLQCECHGDSLPGKLELTEPRNIFRPITFRGSSNRCVTDLPHPICQSGVIGWEVIYRSQGFGKSFELCRDGKARSRPPFPGNVSLVKVQDCTRSQVITEAVQRTHHFSCMISDVSYVQFRLKSGVSLRSNRSHTVIVTGGSFCWKRRSWNSTSLVSDALNVSRQILAHWDVRAWWYNKSAL